MSATDVNFPKLYLYFAWGEAQVKEEDLVNFGEAALPLMGAIYGPARAIDPYHPKNADQIAKAKRAVQVLEEEAKGTMPH